MTTLQEQMQQELDSFLEGNEDNLVPKKPEPVPVVKDTQSKTSGSLQESMQEQINELETADATTETYVEKQNNIVVSEDQLREQAALGLPYAGEYDDEEIKTIKQQTEENFSRTKKSIAEIKKDNEDMEAYLKEKGITSQEFFEQEVKPKLSEALKENPVLNKFIDLTGEKGYNALNMLANGVELTASAYTDLVQEGLEVAQNTGIGFETTKNILSFGGKFDVGDTPQEIAEEIADNTGTLLEFAETLPFTGGVIQPANKFNRLAKQGIKYDKQLQIARRNNVGGALLATQQAREEARIEARKIAKQNTDIKDNLIKEYEINTGARNKDGKIIDQDKIISIENDDGTLTVDYDLARKASEKTRRDLFDIQVDDEGNQVVVADQMSKLVGSQEGLLSPVLDPNKLDSLVAVVATFKKKYPNHKAFKDKNKGVIESLLDITLDKELVGDEELLTTLNKYGLSFEEYISSTIGSFSDAGKLLNIASQIKRTRPVGEIDDIAQKKLIEAQNKISQAGTRLENVRRGAMVSQIATAMRNLESAAIRIPMESLGNMVDMVMHEFGKPIKGGVLDGEGGFVGATKALFDKDNWKNSFAAHKYVFSRPDVAKGYSDLLLNRPEFEAQASRMFDNLNEIRIATGRGEGGLSDKLLNPLEDTVELMNFANRWQEHLVRRGVFFSELQRLAKKEYNIDLIDALQDGKLPDLLNDSSTVRPDGARSFVALVNDSIEQSLAVTYAKQPDNKLFRDITNIMTSRKVFGVPLTTVVEFPRFMFNSMEIMAQYGAGGAIPLTKKMMDIVNPTGSKITKMTPKDRQALQRNIVGLAAIGAAYQYRTSENAPEDYKLFGVGEKAVNTSPIFPMRQFLYIGEALKHLNEGTFDSVFWNPKDFAETFAGTTFRTGTGNIIIEEISQIADGMDISGGKKAAELTAKAVSNYFNSFLTGFGQIIDLQRSLGVRDNTYKQNIKPAPKDAIEAAQLEVEKAYNNRFRDMDEEREMEDKSVVFEEDVERPDPTWKITTGINLRPRDSDTGEYFIRHGVPKWRVGSNSDIDAVAAFENEKLKDFVPILHDAMLKIEENFAKKYDNFSDVKKEKVSKEAFLKTKMKPLLTTKLSQFKTFLKQSGSKGIADKYSRALSEFNRVSKDYRRIALVDYIDRNDGDEPDLTDPNVLNKLTATAKKYQNIYRKKNTGLMSR
jgi:YD repeat-containing protein